MTSSLSVSPINLLAYAQDVYWGINNGPACTTAVMMATHPRLGNQSPLSMLEPDVLKIVCSHLSPPALTPYQQELLGDMRVSKNKNTDAEFELWTEEEKMKQNLEYEMYQLTKRLTDLERGIKTAQRNRAIYRMNATEFKRHYDDVQEEREYAAECQQQARDAMEADRLFMYNRDRLQHDRQVEAVRPVSPAVTDVDVYLFDLDDSEEAYNANIAWYFATQQAAKAARRHRRRGGARLR